MIQPLENIYKKKGSDTAVFLGSGPSINDITDKQWNRISEFDVWAVNNFIYHWFTDINFYHFYVKKFAKDIWKQRKAEKGDAYKNTNFIIKKDKKDFLLDLLGNEKNVYEYTMQKQNISKESLVPTYIEPNDPNTIVCNLNATITVILELFYNFRYKNVILFGVDMNTSEYFWSNGQYGKTHCIFNKDHEEGKTIEQPHNTIHVKDFIIWFSKEKMKKIGGKIYVGHKKTILYPHLEYREI
jgi:hypothetical protein